MFSAAERDSEASGAPTAIPCRPYHCELAARLRLWLRAGEVPVRFPPMPPLREIEDAARFLVPMLPALQALATRWRAGEHWVGGFYR